MNLGAFFYILVKTFYEIFIFIISDFFVFKKP